MTAINEFLQKFHCKSIGKCAWLGAFIAFVSAIVFLSVILLFGGVLDGKNFRQAIWEFFPLITMTCGGTIGGIIYYMLVKVWFSNGWKKILATIFSILIFIALVWISLAAGFSATGLWD